MKLFFENYATKTIIMGTQVNDKLTNCTLYNINGTKIKSLRDRKINTDKEGFISISYKAQGNYADSYYNFIDVMSCTESSYHIMVNNTTNEELSQLLEFAYEDIDFNSHQEYMEEYAKYKGYHEQRISDIYQYMVDAARNKELEELNKNYANTFNKILKQNGINNQYYSCGSWDNIPCIFLTTNDTDTIAFTIVDKEINVLNIEAIRYGSWYDLEENNLELYPEIRQQINGIYDLYKYWLSTIEPYQLPNHVINGINELGFNIDGTTPITGNKFAMEISPVNGNCSYVLIVEINRNKLEITKCIFTDSQGLTINLGDCQLMEIEELLNSEVE